LWLEVLSIAVNIPFGTSDRAVDVVGLALASAAAATFTPLV
jgi:hypothetical protein